jgi:hypothetical protein
MVISRLVRSSGILLLNFLSFLSRPTLTRV